MKKILGIDTGGTYTDVALLEADTKNILYKSKTLTTKENLSLCLEKAFDGIPKIFLRDISMVCLSTTLATNAIVENHGCREGLILIGKSPKGVLPTTRYELVEGLFDIQGRQKLPLNLEELARKIENFRRDKVDAIAISGYAGIRNPAHEIAAAKMVREMLNIPVVCAHELTNTLGYYERTVTAVLNARLIPMTCKLMDSVQSVMKNLSLDVPLMIVRGDGSLMSESCARERPIETILSGPAASVMGGMFLSGKNDAFIMDIGGTTTDIANVTAGKVNIRNEGAKVGQWLTHVRAAEIFTAGLGGDSRIWLDCNRQINLGPERSIPFCMAANKFPSLTEELEHIKASGAWRHYCHHEEEAFVLIKKFRQIPYTSDEKIIIEILRSQPHTLDFLQNNVPLKNLRQTINELLREGVLARISLTPTDILHYTGDYRIWSHDISEVALCVAAGQCSLTNAQFVSAIQKKFTETLNRYTIQAAMYFDCRDFDVQNDTAVQYFLDELYFNKKSKNLEASYTLKKDIVAIGAPAAAWAKDLAEEMKTCVIIPEHAEVANAVGAAVGKFVRTIEILIRKDNISGKFIVYSPLARRDFESIDEATTCAEEVGRECLKKFSEGLKCIVGIKRRDVIYKNPADGSETFVERVMRIMGNYSE